MTGFFELEVTGIEETRDALFQLESAMRTDIASRAMRAAVTVFEGPMRAAAPGALSRNIMAEVRSYQGGLSTVGVVGPTVAVSGMAHIVHYGTAERHHKSGKSTGRMPANPFVERTFISYQSRALSVLSSELAAGLEARAAA